MPLTPPTARALVAALLLLPLAACDETTGLDADVAVLVDDAVAARQGGDLTRAVALLESAFERQPADPEVRVELATTLLQRDGLDLMDLDRIGRFLSETAGTEASRSASAAPARQADYCALADDPSARPFDPTEVAGFDALAAHAATLARTADLLGPVVPAALQRFDVCTSVVDGELAYDRDAALAALAGQGLTEAQVAQALAVNALARFLDAYLFVAERLPQQTTWYRRADGTVVICVEDEAALRADAEQAVRGVGQAVLSLDARAALVGSGSVAAEIVAVALGAYQELRSAVPDYCQI